MPIFINHCLHKTKYTDQQRLKKKKLNNNEDGLKLT